MSEQAIVRYATKDGYTPTAFHHACPDLISLDVPAILGMIHALAEYEKAAHEVQATEQTLLSTLSFPPFPSPGFAKTLLIFPAASPASPAGMAMFFHNYSTWRAAPGTYLEDLFVWPKHRGKGYGSRLLQELARETKKVGGARLEWSVLKWNEPSIKFYVGGSVNATRMEDWVGMRVDGDALEKLAEGKVEEATGKQ